MVRSLFDTALATVCQHVCLVKDVAMLPSESKERLLEYFSSHDMLASENCLRIFSDRNFGNDIGRINFFLSDQLNDEILTLIVGNSQNLYEITIIECPNVTDQGIINITSSQNMLFSLNLRSMRNLSSHGLKEIYSPVLHSVDLSGCFKITSEAIFELCFHNPSIRKLYLNNCRGLDDQALYDIAHYIGENLDSIELDFLPNLSEPANTILAFSKRCPNISQLSLCRFFEPNFDSMHIEYQIEGAGLREIDLYGNYFATLPILPPTIRRIRLSVTGEEDAKALIERLELQPQLTELSLQLECLENEVTLVERANTFLCEFLGSLGQKITRLQITLYRLSDATTSLITSLPNLTELALDVLQLNVTYLRKFFLGGVYSKGAQLKTLKLCRLRITQRVLFAIGKSAVNLVELETSHILSVDDKFLLLLAENCKQLRSVNFNGCRWVTDKGIVALAKNGLLCEVRLRGTGCTDKSLYRLAQHCPEIEWVAHSDFSGRPKFSEKALQCLRESCIQRCHIFKTNPGMMQILPT
ncbi:hypothetical protein M3Y97_00541800 [Aphelenchoides bicaudatus]|nr:hypothetical protein M3Y97_00541800 [Aphelenchoides bicaudatus]